MRIFYRFKVFGIILTSIFILLSSTNSVVAENTPNLAIETKAMSEGTKIPEVSKLKTVKGKNFDLNKAISEKPTVLIFYRGGWCPYCNAQLSKLNSIESKLVEMGFQIIAISPDKPENLRESIKKHKLTYLLLSDSKMETAKAFGVAFKVDEATLFKYKAIGIDLKKA